MQLSRTCLAMLLGVVVVQSVPVFADEAFERRFQAVISAMGITDEAQIKAMRAQLEAPINPRDQAQFRAVAQVCREDLNRLCMSEWSYTALLQCIQKHRDEVQDSCEAALKTQLGSKPLAQEEVYLGVRLPKGSSYLYDPQGHVLSANIPEMIEYRGIRFAKGVIGFHDFRRRGHGVGYGALVEDQVIDGLKYTTQGAMEFVYFYPDGRVQSGILAEDGPVDGVTYQKGTQIMFFPDGRVRNGTLAEDRLIDGIMYRQGTEVRLFPTGGVEAGVVAQPINIGGTQFQAGQSVYFRPNGTLSRGPYRPPILPSSVHQGGRH